MKSMLAALLFWLLGLSLVLVGILALATLESSKPSKVVTADAKQEIPLRARKPQEMLIDLPEKYFETFETFAQQSVSAQCGVVLVHMGESLPDHIYECIDQLIEMGASTVYFIVDHENTYQRLLLTPQVQPVIFRHDEQILRAIQQRFGPNNLFHYSLERFFALRWFMQTYSMKRCIHLEHDNLIYAPLSFLESLFQSSIGERIAIPRDVQDRCIASVVLIGSLESLSQYCNFLEHEQQFSQGDMHSLATFQTRYPQFCSNLPVIPEGVAAFSKPALGVLFDAAAMGQWVGGIDTIHDFNDTRGFINGDVTEYSAATTPVVWSTGPSGKRLPFIQFERPDSASGYDYMFLCNLHVHSKQLHLYRSSSLMHAKDIIQGEKFQALATHKWTSEEEIEREANNSVIVCVTGTILYVHTHLLPLFFQHIWSRLQGRFVLITHNSDDTVNEEHVNYLNDSRLIRWFAQNVEVKHPKLIAIPIGLANSQWEHGKIDLLRQTMAKSQSQNTLAHMYVNLSTTHDLRTRLLHYFTEHPQPEVEMETAARLTYEEFLTRSLKFLYICAPRGNGPDTHRFWETLYLNRIPVTYENEFSRQWNVTGWHYSQVEGFVPATAAELYETQRVGLGRLCLRMSHWTSLITREAQMTPMLDVVITGTHETRLKRCVDLVLRHVCQLGQVYVLAPTLSTNFKSQYPSIHHIVSSESAERFKWQMDQSYFRQHILWLNEDVLLARELAFLNYTNHCLFHQGADGTNDRYASWIGQVLPDLKRPSFDPSLDMMVFDKSKCRRIYELTQPSLELQDTGSFNTLYGWYLAQHHPAQFMFRSLFLRRERDPSLLEKRLFQKVVHAIVDVT